MSAGTKEIANNRKAHHNFHIEERIEGGLMLKGWEVKAIRAGRAQLHDSHISVRGGRLLMVNCHISPLISASSHTEADPLRPREVLLHAREASRLVGKVQRVGYTLVPLDLHFRNGKVKVEIGLAKGKKQYDKRRAIKDREWKREQGRLVKKIRG